MNNCPQNFTGVRRGVIPARLPAKPPSIRISRIGSLLVAALLAQFSGCGSLGGDKVAPPDVNPEQLVEQALKQYEQNGDGALSKEELQACPGILRAFADYDANRDGKIDSAELKSHFESLYSSEVGLMSAGCSIASSGRPVVGATVRFIPEAFLGDAIHAAEGITDRSGYAQMAVPDEKLPESHQGLNMVQVGIYRVEVETSPGEIANPKRPLGVELNPSSRQSTNPAFDLAR